MNRTPETLASRATGTRFGSFEQPRRSPPPINKAFLSLEAFSFLLPHSRQNDVCTYRTALSYHLYTTHNNQPNVSIFQFVFSLFGVTFPFTTILLTLW